MTNIDLLGLDEEKVWTTELAFQHLSTLLGAESKRTTERRLHSLEILPRELNAQTLVDELGRPAIALVTNWVIERARSKRRLLLFSQLASLPGGRPCLHANDARGGRYWVPLPGDADARMVRNALAQLQQHLGRDLTVLASGQLVGLLRNMPSIPSIEFVPQAYSPILIEPADDGASRGLISPHLKRLENESIHILREAIAEAQNPVMMYSVGKDSGVMLHLARKAFYPSQPPFPLLHIDTRWKFQEMYLFRDYMARRSGMRLITHINPEAITKNINPFEHGAARHTEITKTEGLKQALDHYKFDVVIGGARRDEEKSRAKERVFSFRTATHVWDPKNQRPELWNLYNARKERGREHPRVPALQLDRTRYLAIHPPGKHSCRAFVLCAAEAGCRPSRHDNDGQRRPMPDHARRANRDPQDPLSHAGLLSADGCDRIGGRDHRRHSARTDQCKYIGTPGPQDRHR
ncbi:sulfate adenylyltransferase subunit 2 [Burkholderia sp. OAS925]